MLSNEYAGVGCKELSLRLENIVSVNGYLYHNWVQTISLNGLAFQNLLFEQIAIFQCR